MRQGRTVAAALIPDAGDKEPLYELIELLFFAYRDFVGLPAAKFGSGNNIRGLPILGTSDDAT